MSTYTWTDGEVVNATKLNAYGTGIDEAKETILAATTHQPKIENGTWRVWNPDTSAYTDTGIAATGQISVSVEYKEGENGTTAPTGAWSTTVPAVTKGKYLWTRETFNDGTVAYSVAYNGVDGEGSVVSVNGQSGTVVLSASDVGAEAERTVITGTLSSGSTSLTLSSTKITTSSIIDVYTDTYGVNPTNVVASSGSVVLTFDAQTSAVSVRVEVH